MANESVAHKLKDKSAELKKWLQNMNAEIEQWKFSVEDTKEGLRVELHAIGLFKQKPKGK